MMNMTNIKTPTVLFLLCLLVFSGLWFIYPQEFIASDPWTYSQQASQFSKSFNWGDSDVFNHRLAVTLPVSMLYSLCGITIRSTHLWPLICSLLVMLTVWMAHSKPEKKVIGIFLCLFSIPLMKASTTLYPDIIATAFMGISTWILFRRDNYAGTIGRILKPVAAVLFLFIAFLAKESAYWIIPLWIYYAWKDLTHPFQKESIKTFYLTAFITGVILGTGYLIFCNQIWSDPLARFKAIEALTGHHLWSWHLDSSASLLKRLTIAPADLLLKTYNPFIIILFILGLFFDSSASKPWKFYTMSCLLFFWFGSTSFSQYEPMPLVERMSLPLLPGIYILATEGLSYLTRQISRIMKFSSTVVLILLLTLIGLPFFQYLHSWRTMGSDESKALTVIKQDVLTHPDKRYLLLCSDVRSPDSLAFYFGYQYPENLAVMEFDSVEKIKPFPDDLRVFVHKERATTLGAMYKTPVYYEQILALGLPLLYQSQNVLAFDCPSTRFNDVFTLASTLSNPSSHP